MTILDALHVEANFKTFCTYYGRDNNCCGDLDLHMLCVFWLLTLAGLITSSSSTMDTPGGLMSTLTSRSQHQAFPHQGISGLTLLNFHK